MERILLKNIDAADAGKVATYLRNGGYKGLDAAFKMRPEEIVQIMKDSGLRGRGGAGFSTGLKWSFIPSDPSLPKYLLCNADESEPGTFKDRLIIEKAPHLLLEGMMIACYAIGAATGYIYIRGEYEYGARILEDAIAEASSAGYLGRNIRGSGFSLRIYIHRGAGAYICGEETALLESIQGLRGQPRLRPPFPAIAGVYYKPSVINNVETLACVPSILERGPRWFAGIGPRKSPGPKLYAVSGHVKKPGVYELPMEVTLNELIFEHCGGMRGDKAVKAVIPGGASAPMLAGEDLDSPMDFESLAQRGSMLGSAGVVVMEEGTCMVKTAYIINRFFSHESCGKCTPCRDGTPWMTQILKRIEDGKGRPGDVELLESLCTGIFGRCFCALGEAAVMALRGALKYFKEEFYDHIAQKKCTVSTDGLHGF
ncbi:MAG: NADH oxidoreductase (quinone) subunit F [Desulfobacteraceae bacterium]|nr:MAG: NADH oxidoreductase (quinone) subunit F [Desulfobacteraceae bacterium]